MIKNDVLERINNLVEKIGDFEPDVQLLVCDSLGDDDNTAALSALTGQQWCISNGWELVELQPHEPQPDPEEDDFRESWGFKRISQALHACTWSNLDMKGSLLCHSLMDWRRNSLGHVAPLRLMGKRCISHPGN
ncbi:Alpha- and gamma-adaptin-binding protein p34 [Portunus trituberculatus]|uniref:Alpha-and gamma-adaptin-binding protein p34 n=1 Tax=Portunus trituberculatus TaxID=210409 RepID=A0A5B7D294_PORTR|nr:Alpha- and gamma-adaptin-binding protein p34 [Portunus trituberculatus]